MAIAIDERDNSSPPKESKTNTLTVYFFKAQVNDKSLPLSDERGMFWNTMSTTFIFLLDLSVVVLDKCLKDNFRLKLSFSVHCQFFHGSQVSSLISQVLPYKTTGVSGVK